MQNLDSEKIINDLNKFPD